MSKCRRVPAEIARQIAWRSGAAPWEREVILTISSFWYTLLLETCQNDDEAVENLLQSWWSAGYNEGFSDVSRLIFYFLLLIVELEYLYLKLNLDPTTYHMSELLANKPHITSFRL